MLTPSPNLATQRPIVAVLVPTHRGIHPLTQKALSAMMAATCGHVVLRVLGAAPVHQVRNNLLAPLYLNKSQFDYVLFCDDDMVPPPDGINVLLGEHVDIIAAICTNRPPLPKGGALNAGIRLSGQDFQPNVISIEDFRYRTTTTTARRDDGTYTAVTTLHTPVHTPPQPTT